MRSLTRPVAALLLACLATSLVACTDDATPVTSVPIDQTAPLADDEVTKHLLEAPELPAVLEGAVVTTSELRRADLTERHVVELVDVPAATAVTLDAHLPAGAVLRVPAGSSLEIAATADVARLDGDVVAEVIGSCAAPCAVDGPALVAPDGWFVGFTVAEGWLLLVPAPVSEG